MTKIWVYDCDKEDIDKLAEENDTSEENIIEALLSAIKYNDIDIAEYI